MQQVQSNFQYVLMRITPQFGLSRDIVVDIMQVSVAHTYVTLMKTFMTQVFQHHLQWFVFGVFCSITGWKHTRTQIFFPGSASDGTVRLIEIVLLSNASNRPLMCYCKVYTALRYHTLYPDAHARLPLTTEAALRVVVLPTGELISDAHIAKICHVLHTMYVLAKKSKHECVPASTSSSVSTQYLTWNVNFFWQVYSPGCHRSAFQGCVEQCGGWLEKTTENLLCVLLATCHPQQLIHNYWMCWEHRCVLTCKMTPPWRWHSQHSV